MTNQTDGIRRLQDASKQINFRLPANCLKGMRLPAKLCYVSKQTICLDFQGTEYIYDIRSHGDKRLAVHLGTAGEPGVEHVMTLAEVLERVKVYGALIDLSSGDIILQGSTANG